MANTNDFKVLLEAMIDQSSLSNILKQLAKEKLTIHADIDADQSSLSKLGKSLTDQLKQAGKSISQQFSLSSGINFLIAQAKNAVAELKDLDDILTELGNTSNLSARQLKELGLSAYDTASKYGKSASDYLTAVQEMYRSGFQGDQAGALAEQSLLAQSAGNLTADVANNYLLAANAAYQYNGEAEELNAVLDGQNSITTKNNVSMDDMAAAMSKVCAAAADYHVTIENLSAMIGTIEAVTNSGGSAVGDALNAILTNLQNVTSDEINETLDEANASMTEMVYGVEQLRNPIEILRDLSETFLQLDEADPLRTDILTNISGEEYAAELSALLQNMELFDRMLIDYSEGSGSAMEAAAKNAGNLTGSLNALSNSWTEFVNALINSDELTAAVQILNTLLNGLTEISQILGKINSFGGNINGLWGTLGAISGLLMNKSGIGE